MSEVAMLSEMLAEEMQERATEVEALNARIKSLEKDLRIAREEATQAKVAEARALGQLEGAEQGQRKAELALKEEKAKPRAAPVIQAAPGAPEYELLVTARDGNDRIRTVSLVPVKPKGKS